MKIEKQKFNNSNEYIEINGKKYDILENYKVCIGILDIKKLLNINHNIGHKIVDVLIKEFEWYLIHEKVIDVYRLNGGSWFYVSKVKIEPCFLIFIMYMFIRMFLICQKSYMKI